MCHFNVLTFVICIVIFSTGLSLGLLYIVVFWTRQNQPAIDVHTSMFMSRLKRKGHHSNVKRTICLISHLFIQSTCFCSFLEFFRHKKCNKLVAGCYIRNDMWEDIIRWPTQIVQVKKELPSLSLWPSSLAAFLFLF